MGRRIIRRNQRVAGSRGWRQVDGPRWKDREEFLFARAMEHDSSKLLFRLACEHLASCRLVRPGVVSSAPGRAAPVPGQAGTPADGAEPGAARADPPVPRSC